MNAPDTVVVAHWQTSAADLSTVLDHAAALTTLSRAEPGCVGFEVFQSTCEPARLVVIEHYRSPAAQHAHLDSPHYRELVVERIRPLLTGRQVEILRPRGTA